MDNETRTAFADLKAYVGEQNRQLDEKFDKRLGSLDKRMGSLDKRVGNLELENSELNVRLIDQFRAIDRRFESLADEVTERVASYLGVVLEEMKAANRAFRDEMRGHKGVLDDHETRLEHLENPPPRPGTPAAA